MKKRNWRLMLRRVLNLVFSRIVVTGVLLLLQAFWLFALFYWLADYAKWFGGVGVAMSIIMCLALIRQDSTVPEFKISWMILFAVMPVQGGILYLLWGNKRPALGLRHRLERAEDAMAPARKDDPDAAAALQRQDPRAALTARYLHDYGPMPVCGGTAAKYYPDGQSMFADMLPALQGAQHSIYVESFIIGIAGGTGSGKTTLTKRLKERFGDDVSVISHDNYYKRHDELPYEERCRLNYDHPDAFDTDLMVEQVQALRRGETIACPVYDFTVHNRSEDTLLIAPTSVIILEGILIFADSKLRDLMDVKIFVDTDADVRILRRVVRDVKKRGRTLESVVQQYLTTVKPMHEQFVEPSKRCADIIVPEGGKNLVALDMIIQRVEHHIRGQQEP